MRYAIFAAMTLAGFSAGCVPVSEPVGDIDKAAPDSALVGAWGTDESATETKLTIDVPEVKGNPKGLMRAVEKDPKTALWFFVTTIGKQHYANIILSEKSQGVFVNFADEGEFAKWKKDSNKRFFVFKYTRDGDKLAVDAGNEKEVKKVMTAEKIEYADDSKFFYGPTAGWLAKYLDKTGPDKMYDGTNGQKYQKIKTK